MSDGPSDFEVPKGDDLSPVPTLAIASKPVTVVASSFVIVVAVASIMIDRGPNQPSPPTTVTLNTGAAAGIVTTVGMDFQRHPEGIALMALDEPSKAKLRSEIAEGKVRVGMLRIWDALDEDGDRIRIEGVGYRQDVTLQHNPQTFLVPFTPGGSVTIIATGDGGGGGVTLGVGSVLGPTILPPLAAGQAVEIPIL